MVVWASRAQLAGSHAALLRFRTMPIKDWKTAHLVIAFAWAIHALSWFLPVAYPLFVDGATD